MWTIGVCGPPRTFEKDTLPLVSLFFLLIAEVNPNIFAVNWRAHGAQLGQITVAAELHSSAEHLTSIGCVPPNISAWQGFSLLRTPDFLQMTRQ